MGWGARLYDVQDTEECAQSWIAKINEDCRLQTIDFFYKRSQIRVYSAVMWIMSRVRP